VFARLQLPLGKGQSLKMLLPGVIFDAEITAQLFLYIDVYIFFS
jgi:hypothetical protein